MFYYSRARVHRRSELSPRSITLIEPMSLSSFAFSVAPSSCERRRPAIDTMHFMQPDDHHTCKDVDMPTRPSGHAGKSARDDDVTDRRRRKETAWLFRHERIHLNAYAGLESSRCEQARRRRFVRSECGSPSGSRR